MVNYQNSTYLLRILLTTVLLSATAGTILSQSLDVKQISSFEELRFELFEIAPDGKWFIYLENGELFTSINEGASWLPFAMPPDEKVVEIKFFSDGAPFITTNNPVDFYHLKHYTWNGTQWVHLPNLESTSYYSRVPNLTIYNDTIWHATGSELYISADRGVNSEKIIESDGILKIKEVHISDKFIYLLSASQYIEVAGEVKRSFYEKYDRNFSFEEFSINTNIGKLSVTSNDQVESTIVHDASGVDGGYQEFLYSVITGIPSIDFKVNGDKAYFTYDGYNLGVYDLLTEELKTYEINQQGQIHFHDDKIFIADKNKILDVTDYETNQIKTIVPDLKRTYTDAKEYMISPQGIIYAYTGYNVFSYTPQDSTWQMLDLGHDNIVDFDLSPSGIFYGISNRNFFVSEDGQSTQTKEHDSYFFQPTQTQFDYRLSSMAVYNDSTIFLYGYIPGTLSGTNSQISTDEGDIFYNNYSFPSYYGIEQLGDDGVFSSGRVLIDGDNMTPMWDQNHPDLVGLPFGYQLLPIDSALIYLHPGSYSRYPGFNLVTRDLGQTWDKTTFGPIGDIYEASEYEATWVYNIRGGRLYYRKDLFSTYEEIDISSVGYVRNILAEPDGVSYFDNYGELYALSDLFFHPQRISGQLFSDDDDNCNFDIGEDIMGQSWAFTLTGTNYQLTTISNDGTYDFDLPLGDFRLEVHSPSDLWTLCDSIYDISVTDVGQSITQDIGIQADEQCAQLEISLTTSKVKRCKSTRYTLNVKNTGTFSASDVQVDITPDPLFSLKYNNFSVPSEILPNGDIRLDIGNLGILESKRANLRFDVSCSAALGQQHCMTAKATADNLCNGMTAESTTEYQNNVGPFDPNDLRVFNEKGYRALNFEKEEKQFYHVRFQNTGTDTAENAEVHVLIDDSLDISTLRVLDSSHDFDFYLNDAHDLILKFDNIMLPDSFVNEPASNGYFRFSIKPHNTVSEGQQFKSWANIYFDFNAAVQTNVCNSQIGQSCNEPIVEELDIYLCQGETYDGYRWSGFYQDYLTSESGCDSIRQLNLKIQRSKFSRGKNVYLCQGESYKGITVDTVLVDSLFNHLGCDSIYSQRIFMSEWIADIENFSTGCIGDTILGYYESGVYMDTIRNSSYCYRRITDLTITEPEYIQETYHLCSGETLDTITESGIYTDTIRTFDLCDSLIIQRVVNISEEISTIVNIHGCEGENHEGYDKSGSYTDVLETTAGCDSTRILILELFPQLIHTESMAICEGDEYLGYTETGTYSDTFTSVKGCDSIRILDLKALPKSMRFDTLFLCPWEEHKGHHAPYTFAETFANSYGCDSIETIELLLLNRDDPVCAYQYDRAPKLMIQTQLININPNPVYSEFTLEVMKLEKLPATLKLIDIKNKLIEKHVVESQLTTIDISNLPKGIYQAVLQTGNNTYVHRIVKI